VTAVLGELGKKLAERWLALLALPGLLFVSVAVVAGVLGHGRALHFGALRTWFGTFTPASGVAAAIAVLLGAASAGLVAAAVGRLVQGVWTSRGRRAPARWLVSWRRRRWDRAYATVRAVLAAKATDQPSDADLATALARCNRISLIQPARPAWIGDRLRAVDERVHRTYKLDVSAAWPRLWMLLPDAARAELGTAHDSFAGAARLLGWALLYLIVGVLWWPAFVIAMVTGVTAWVRARSATAVLADLAEGAVDLYGPELAAKLGFECEATLTPELGLEITKILRKDDTVHPVPLEKP
jgi:hypothetical protein